MRRTGILLAALLTGCGNPRPPPPPPPPPPAQLPITIGPGAAWMITQGSSPRALSNGSFDFLRCDLIANPQNPAELISPCWDSYVEVAYGADISAARSVTLDYEITGLDPVFSAASPGNTCPGLPSLTLLLHRTLDAALTIPTYRQFSFPSTQPLQLGHVRYMVLMEQGNWVNVQGQSNFGDTLANIGSLGFVLGGKCFAGHGVSLTSGNARLQINSYVID